MGKHTPGPWDWSFRYTTEDSRSTWTLLGDGGYGILSCDGEGNSPQGIGDEANARLIAAAPDLLDAQMMGTGLDTPDFLNWVADRLVHVYGESENVDFVISLRARASAGRAAIAKATHE